MKYTKKELLATKPCAGGLAFAKTCDFDFVKIYATCPRGDWLIWLLRQTGQITKPQAVQIAVECAKHVLPIFEKRRPDDKRPRQAIEAAEAWLKDPSEKNRGACRADADAADAAAYAYAAYAAAAADDADDDAAYAAYAAYAAADAAAAARTKTLAQCAVIVRKYYSQVPMGL